MENQEITILLVEDNPGDARLVREALAEAGATEFKLAYAERLADAIQRLRTEHFDVILLDLSLPDGHGLDTFTQAHSRARGVPIVVLTGLGDETMAIKAVRQGAQDYLVKGEVDGSRLVRALRYAIERHRRPPEGAIRDGLSRIFYVLQRSGLRVSENRLDDLIKAVAARSAAVGHISIDKYFNKLTKGRMASQEFKELVKVLTVGETYFFRTPNHMWAFRDDMLPQVVAAREGNLLPSLSGKPITIWSAGCSTGEEPYGLAMLVDESRALFPQARFKFLGTDVNEDSLTLARAAQYEQRSINQVPPTYLERYFTSFDGKYALTADIRRMVDFTYHNLLEPALPPPVSAPNSVDVIFCRNVFIYFADEIVTEIARRFFNVLLPGGFLVVGHSETLDRLSTGFEMVFLSGAYIYRKPLTPEQKNKLAERAAARKLAPQSPKPKPPPREQPPPAQPAASPEEAARVLTEQARLSADRGDYEQALRSASDAIKLDPRNARAHYVLGLVHWTKGETEHALTSFSRATDLDPDFALASYYLAEAQRRAGQPQEALQSYTDTIEILQRQPPDRVLWGSENLTALGLAEICRTAVQRLKTELPST